MPAMCVDDSRAGNKLGWLVGGNLRCHYPAFPFIWKDSIMTLGLTPLISLIAGILILVMPRLLNYIVALYLIVIGLIGLFGAGGITLR